MGIVMQICYICMTIAFVYKNLKREDIIYVDSH